MSEETSLNEWKIFEPVCILMNMIRTEQMSAYSSLPSLHALAGELLTSGIRKEERTLYLDQMKKWEWSAIEECEEEGWMAFRFIKINLCEK